MADVTAMPEKPSVSNKNIQAHGRSASDITTGYSGTDRFGPDDKCTRGQVVTFIYRCFE